MLRRAFVLLAVYSFALVPTLAQRGPYSFGGTVVPYERSAEHIEVVLEKDDDAVVARTFTDARGRYEFRDLVRGIYYARIELKGYQPVRMRIDLMNDFTSRSLAPNIFLNPETGVREESGSDDSDVIDLAELRRKYPKRIVEEYEKAFEEIRNANVLAAKKRLESLLKAAPGFYPAHNTLGTIHQATKSYREAEREYNSARELNPRFLLPVLNLASVYIEESELVKALDALREALTIQPRSALANYWLGVTFFRGASYDDAEDHLRRALRLNGALANARLMLANVYMKKENWKNALDHLDAYLAENPKTADRAEVIETRSKVIQRIQ